jgi:UDP:flavonoid glycosyltransferase YjiC (YdhE family)
MTVLPLPWDQDDYAQRVHEPGLGIRTPGTGHSAHDEHGAVREMEDLVGDTADEERLEV